MIFEPAEDKPAAQSSSGGLRASTNVVSLRPPSRWHDPLSLIQTGAPARSGRIVLWTISLLILFLLVWAGFGELDIIVTADGKLAPETLVKVVQPADAGVLKELLVNEGDAVKKGQVLARLDMTLANADTASVGADLATQKIQQRRVEAELTESPLRQLPGDEPSRFADVFKRYEANQKAFRGSMEQEKSLLVKAEQEMRSAIEIERKYEQTLPNYLKTAKAYSDLEKEGFISGMAADEKRRDATEKEKDLAAQRATVAAFAATVVAQQQKLAQLKSVHDSDLQRELSDLRNRIQQLQPELDKAVYRAGLLDLKAPQDGIIVDLATTTIGAVFKPGEVLLTLVPQDERLTANVSIKNEDVGFIRPKQTVRIKLAAYPFQKYGMLTGKVVQLGADTSSSNPANGSVNTSAGTNAADRNPALALPSYKATIAVDSQFLASPAGERLQLSPGMQVTAEIQQGKRTVLDYLLSPVKKAAQEAGRER